MARNVSELDLLDLQKQGQRLYKQRKYEEALKCFDQAIQSGVEPPNDLLDNRAATYARLSRFKPALRDAKRMIEQGMSNSTGYLRTGSILQLCKKPDTALEIYQLGLRRVPQIDPKRMQLQDFSNRLTRQCAPSKICDPLQALPREMVDMIISFMTFRQIVCLLRVSKSWRDLLHSTPRLWTDLDFSGSIRKFSMATVRRYVQNAQGACYRIHLDRSGRVQEESLEYVATRCRGLKAIRLSSRGLSASLLKAVSSGVNLQVLVLSPQCDIACKQVSRLLNLCVTLERAEFHSVVAERPYDPTHDLSRMHTLVMNGAQGPPGCLGFEGLLAQAPQLRSLTLQNWIDGGSPSAALDFSHLSKLEHLDIRYVGEGLYPGLPRSIRSVNMTGCRTVGFGAITPEDFCRTAVLPNLSTFYVGYSNVHSQSALMLLITTNAQGLKAVDLSERSFGNEPSRLIHGDCLASVERLILKDTHLDDEGVSLIVYKLRNIKHLDLARTFVTGVSVKMLITAFGSQLEWLGLDECIRTSIDAVELARSQGIKVSYNFPDVRGGKKVRHGI